MLGNLEDENDLESTIIGCMIQVKLQNVIFRKQSTQSPWTPKAIRMGNHSSILTFVQHLVGNYSFHTCKNASTQDTYNFLVYGTNKPVAVNTSTEAIMM